MQIKLADLLRDPDHFLFAIEGDRAIFMPMDRAAYRRSLFLDGRISPASRQVMALSADQLGGLVARNGTPQPRTGWIFHVAHCGSTLLARAMDSLGTALVLREPGVLRQLAVATVGSGGASPQLQDLLRLTTAMLARRYAPDEPAIVKANVPVNFILPDLVAPGQAAPAILLYLPLSAYLMAVLRTPGHRGWVERVTAELAPAILADGGPPPTTIAERAAALWLAQIRAFAALLDRHAGAATLDAGALFSDPAPVLMAAFAHLGVAGTPAQIAAIAGGDLFRTHAKDPGRPFDEATRRARDREGAAGLARELADARQWVERRTVGQPLPERLAGPLHGASPLLV